ncbi:MAG: DUF3553 domain-containing protein [Planctomycetes bacterium]|nr:DUF3553 domain-containing protein [Planctomycetota bacterium]
MPNLKVADFVRHTACPEWGLGQIVDIRGSLVVVHFETSNRAREFRLPCEQLVAAADAANDPPKVNLMRRFGGVSNRSRSKRPTKSAALPSFDEVLRTFREAFPAGFGDGAWAAERRALERASSRAQLLLEKAKWAGWIDRAEFADLGKAFREVSQTEGLVHPAQALKVAGIRDADFWRAMKRWSWREEAGHDALDAVAAGLAAVEQASWSNATVLRGILFPESELFVRPDSLKKMAVIAELDLPYESKPSAAGYAPLLQFVGELRARLVGAGLAPRDLWDVGQFCRIATGAKKAAAETPTRPPAAADEAAG